MSHCNVTISDVVDYNTFWSNNNNYLQVILFEIDCAIFYTNLHELFCQFISWTNWVNSGKFLDNCWISCQAMADMKKVYDNLKIISLHYHSPLSFLLFKIVIAWQNRIEAHSIERSESSGRSGSSLSEGSGRSCSFD